MKIFTSIALLFCCSLVLAQENAEGGSIEKSIFNVQAGPVGLWINNEFKLGEKFALRTEIGIDLWTYETTTDETGTFFTPSINVEPRWYYNISKRHMKGKHTAHNSANFITIGVEYFPDLFTIGSHPSYVRVPDQITIIPKWGIRRSMGNTNFNYEFGGGVGYIGYLSNNNLNMNYGADVGIDIHVRIGYTFK